jgi:hypothetical protein
MREKKMPTDTNANKRAQQFKPTLLATEEALQLWRTKQARLKELMEKGQRPEIESLEGWVFRGLNIGIGAGLIGRRKFIKAFYLKDYGYGKMLTGNNFIVEQNNPADEYILKMRNDMPIPEGYYLVEHAKFNKRWQRYPQAALLHYGKADNAWSELPGYLRDYLVQPFPDNPDILLGRAYFSIGLLRLAVGFFVLERLRKMEV